MNAARQNKEILYCRFIAGWQQKPSVYIWLYVLSFFLKAFTDNATTLHTRICKKGRQRNPVTFVLQHIKLLLRQRLRTTKIMSKSLNLFAYTTASEINKINTDIILVFFRTEF